MMVNNGYEQYRNYRFCQYRQFGANEITSPGQARVVEQSIVAFINGSGN